jgi:hypothetical protein
MEEFIYLIIVAGWVLYNAYKKSQVAKAKREAEQPSVYPMDEEEREVLEEPSSFEKMILEQLGGKRIDVRNDRAERPQVVKHAPSPFLNFDAPKTGEARRARKVEAAKREQELVVEPIGSDYLEDGFDLRRAVIYDAVLQRPYA